MPTCSRGLGADDVLNGNEGDDSVSGGSGDDNLQGRPGDDALAGGDGADALRGGAGADSMAGGRGDDVYVTDSTLDLVVEAAGEGTDLVRSSARFTLADDVENLVPKGAGTIDGVGNGGANRLTGNDGDNLPRGLDRTDVLLGQGGADTLVEGSGADALRGGAGDDRLVGVDGRDLLTGDAGADLFVFDDVGDSGSAPDARDRVTDFGRGSDRIDVSLVDAVAGGADDAFALDAGGAFEAGQVRQTAQNGNLLLEFNVDGDAAAEMSIALPGIRAPLSASDFLLWPSGQGPVAAPRGSAAHRGASWIAGSTAAGRPRKRPLPPRPRPA